VGSSDYDAGDVGRTGFTYDADSSCEGRNDMGIIGWIILGLLAGLIAKAILPGDQPGGIIVTTIVGVVGAIIAGFIAQAIGFGDPIDEFFDWSTWIAAIIGAIVLLLVWQAIAGRRRGGQRRIA